MVASDFMDNLARRYVQNNNQVNPQNLSHADSWTILKVICSLVIFKARSGQEQLRIVKWKGFTLPPDQFLARLDASGMGNLDLETPSQTPWFMGMLHSVQLSILGQ